MHSMNFNLLSFLSEIQSSIHSRRTLQLRIQKLFKLIHFLADLLLDVSDIFHNL